MDRQQKLHRGQGISHLLLNSFLKEVISGGWKAAGKLLKMRRMRGISLKGQRVWMLVRLREKERSVTHCRAWRKVPGLRGKGHWFM